MESRAFLKKEDTEHDIDADKISDEEFLRVTTEAVNKFIERCNKMKISKNMIFSQEGIAIIMNDLAKIKEHMLLEEFKKYQIKGKKIHDKLNDNKFENFKILFKEYKEHYNKMKKSTDTNYDIVTDFIKIQEYMDSIIVDIMMHAKKFKELKEHILKLYK